MPTLGETAFNAYVTVMGGRTHDGQPVPAWDDLGDLVRAAWQAAAGAADAPSVGILHGLPQSRWLAQIVHNGEQRAVSVAANDLTRSPTAGEVAAAARAQLGVTTPGLLALADPAGLLLDDDEPVAGDILTLRPRVLH